MTVEVLLENDEDIIRVYTRYQDDEPWTFKKLRSKDFARIMASHSGISLWRLKYCTPAHAMAQLKTKKLTGTAICKARTLKELGLRFYGSNAEDPHVSARCVGCNLNLNYSGHELCQKVDSSDCGFKLEAAKSLCAKLANKKFFKIDLAIKKPDA